MLAGIVLLLVTGSVFFFSLVIFGVLSKAYEQYQERYVVKSMNDLSDMFLFIDPRQMLVLNIASHVPAGHPRLRRLQPAGRASALTIFGFFLPMMLVKHYRKRRIKKFNTQLVDALQAMANAFKAGLTFPQAIEHVAREAHAAAAAGVRPLREGGQAGRPAGRGAHQHGQAGGQRRPGAGRRPSTNIARQLGGNMAEMFETISGHHPRALPSRGQDRRAHLAGQAAGLGRRGDAARCSAWCSTTCGRT